MKRLIDASLNNATFAHLVKLAETGSITWTECAIEAALIMAQQNELLMKQLALRPQPIVIEHPKPAN